MEQYRTSSLVTLLVEIHMRVHSFPPLRTQSLGNVSGVANAAARLIYSPVLLHCLFNLETT
jgi:hypothetical protein